MSNFNRVYLMGNLTRDVELKSTNNGGSVARLGLAINRTWTGADGEKREEVLFVDCEAWGKQAETLAKYMAKGKPIFIEGRLKLDQWEDKEGQKQSKLRVVVEGFQFIGGKGDDERQTAGKPEAGRGDLSRNTNGRPSAPKARPNIGDNDPPFGGDDIPFDGAPVA